MIADVPVLRMIDASHSYDGTHWQFRNLDLALARAEVTAILGTNGRGKSTLLRVLGGLQAPTSGRLVRHPRMGFVPQDFAGAFPYTVLDVVLMGRARDIALFAAPGKADVERALAALDATGMAGFAGRDITSLSGGQRQLVLIARALAGENALLLLDEPASALDLKNQDIVLTQLGRLADSQRLSIAFTTHQPNHAVAVADRVLLMLDDARTVFGTTAAMLTEANLSALYGIAVRSARFENCGCSEAALVPVFRKRIRKPASDA